MDPLSGNGGAPQSGVAFRFQPWAAVTLPASAWPGSSTWYSNRPGAALAAQCAACLLGVLELAANDQFLTGQLDADVVLGHAG